MRRERPPTDENISPESEQTIRWFNRKIALQTAGYQDQLRALAGEPVPNAPFVMDTRLQIIEDMQNPYFSDDERAQAVQHLHGRMNDLNEEEVETIRRNTRHWIEKVANPFISRERAEQIQVAYSIVTGVCWLIDHEADIWNAQSIDWLHELRTRHEERLSNRFSRPEQINDARITLSFLDSIIPKMLPPDIE